eukprot:scaffold587_cov339-Pavlova_lutheri.AAC.46
MAWKACRFAAPGRLLRIPPRKRERTHDVKRRASSGNGLLETLRTLQEVERRGDAAPWTADEVLLGLPWLADARKRKESGTEDQTEEFATNVVELKKSDARALGSCFALADAMYEMWRGDETDVDAFLALLDNVRYEDVLFFEPRSYSDRPAHALIVVHEMRAVVLVVRGTEGRDPGAEEVEEEEDTDVDEEAEHDDGKGKENHENKGKKKHPFGFGFVDSDAEEKEKEKKAVKGYGYGVLRPDVLMDLSAAPEPFPPGGPDAYAHGGMLKAANLFVDKYYHTIAECLRRPECKGYGVLTVGHSLGAGVAILSASLLNEQFRGRRNISMKKSKVAHRDGTKRQTKERQDEGVTAAAASGSAPPSQGFASGEKVPRATGDPPSGARDQLSLLAPGLFRPRQVEVSKFLSSTSNSSIPTIRCVAFATPAVLSLDAARAASEFTVSVVGGEDAVPHMSARSVECLRAELRSLDWKRGVQDELTAPIGNMFKDRLGDFWGSAAEDQPTEIPEDKEEEGEAVLEVATDADVEKDEGLNSSLSEVVNLWNSAWEALQSNDGQDENEALEGNAEDEMPSVGNPERVQSRKVGSGGEVEEAEGVSESTIVGVKEDSTVYEYKDEQAETVEDAATLDEQPPKGETVDEADPKRNIEIYRLPHSSPYVPRDVPEGFCLYPAGMVLWFQDFPKGFQESEGGRMRVAVSDPVEFERLPLSEEGIQDHVSHAYWRRLRLASKYAPEGNTRDSLEHIVRLFRDRVAHNDAKDARDAAFHAQKKAAAKLEESIKASQDPVHDSGDASQGIGSNMGLLKAALAITAASGFALASFMRPPRDAQSPPSSPTTTTTTTPSPSS